MVEDVETSKVLEELARHNSSASGNAGRSRFRGTGWLVFAFLLLPLLGGAAVIGYLQWTLYLRLNLLATENNQLQESLRAGESRLAALEAYEDRIISAPDTAVEQNELAELRRQFTSRLEELDQVIDELSQRISSANEIDDSDLLLAEAALILNIANSHLLLTQDARTTSRLYDAADQILQDSGDSRVSSIREVLAHELAQLRSLETVNIADLHEQITALRAMIGTVDFPTSIGDSYQQRLAQAKENNAAVADQPRTLMDSGLDFFASIFIFTKWENRPDIFQPDQSLLAVPQAVDLMLQQAQLALLSRQSSIYQQNLQEARNLVEGQIDTSDRAAAAILSQMDALLIQELAPTLPDVSRSLLMIQQLITERRENSGLDPH